MKDITGKVLIFTDQHFGIKGNSPSRQKIGVRVIDQIVKTIDEQGIENIIFAGDYFHVRSQISVDTINIAYKCMQRLAEKCRVILILGNHDLFMKNSVDINSMNMFQDIPNVEIVSSACSVGINGRKCLMVPWLADLSAYTENQFDFMIGHFEVQSKFLIQSYVEQHSKREKTSNADMMSVDDALGVNSGESEPESGKYLGNFANLVKRSGVIFAGHIHQHREFSVNGRKFIFVGSPYQQNLGDIGYDCGYYVLDGEKYNFVRVTGIPVHVQLKCSEIMSKGVDDFDYGDVKENIVQKIYDVDVSASDDSMINQHITDMHPYEELLPDYQVQLDLQSADEDGTSAALIRKSKLEYVKKYIDNIQSSVFEQSGIDKGRLTTLMTAYYKKAVGE